jgi:protein-tyrosine phosphatase
MAEGIFNHLINQMDLSHPVACDSAGTAGFHIDCQPDIRAQQICRNHNIELRHKARIITADDFNHFDMIVSMDRSVFDTVKRMAPEGYSSQLVLMRKYDDTADSEDVPDPYYGSIRNFEEVFDILMRSCTNFVRQHLR